MKDIKIFLDGEYNKNEGPSNVNRELIKSSNGKIGSYKHRNKYLKRIEKIIGMITCDVLIISTPDVYGPKMLKIRKKFFPSKKSVYLMHGYNKFENDINHLGLSDERLNTEQNILRQVDLVLGVSESFEKWLVKEVPWLKGKTFFLNNGIVQIGNHIIHRQNNDGYLHISVAGGDREIKNNDEIARAVEALNQKNVKSQLKIYGAMVHDAKTFSKYGNTLCIGQLESEDFYQELSKSDIFILNSEVESFGLSVIDALQAGCSVLVSQYAGVNSILSLDDNDIIFDPHDINEIIFKIQNVSKNPNNARMVNKIDYEHYSWRNVSDRLVNICNCLYCGGDYKSIR